MKYIIFDDRYGELISYNRFIDVWHFYGGINLHQEVSIHFEDEEHIRIYENGVLTTRTWVEVDAACR